MVQNVLHFPRHSSQHGRFFWLYFIVQAVKYQTNSLTLRVAIGEHLKNNGSSLISGVKKMFACLLKRLFI